MPTPRSFATALPSARSLAWPAGLGDMETALTYAGAQVDTSANGKVEHLSFKKISGGATLNGPFDFAGVGDQYFGAVFMPDKPDDASVVTFQHKIDIAKVKASNDKGAAPASKELPVLGAALGDAVRAHPDQHLRRSQGRPGPQEHPHRGRREPRAPARLRLLRPHRQVPLPRPARRPLLDRAA